MKIEIPIALLILVVFCWIGFIFGIQFANPVLDDKEVIWLNRVDTLEVGLFDRLECVYVGINP